jgi:hypothetical protein
VKTDKELLDVLKLHERMLTMNPSCPGCEDCISHRGIIAIIRWQLYGDSRVDRYFEEVTKKMDDIGVPKSD